MKIDKNDLLSQLENAKNNYILVLASISLFSDEDALQILKKKNCQFSWYSIKFSQVSNMMTDKENLEIANKEFLLMWFRALIKESFELILNYSKHTNQYEGKFKKEGWYDFSRIIRNSLSHNYKFEFSKSDKNKLPVVWNNIVINNSMDKSYLDLSLFWYKEWWELFNEMNKFVVDKLN